MLKYLRIAVTALCLTACVLLIALWVRSYWWYDYATLNVPRFCYAVAWSVDGTLIVRVHYGGRRDAGWQISVYRNVGGVSEFHRGFNLESNPSGLCTAPHWFALLLSMIFAAVPWLPWFKRFSLRTLLIATLVAVGLGIVVIAR
jgi:hypothetical protein